MDVNNGTGMSIVLPGDPRFGAVIRGFNQRWIADPAYVRLCGGRLTSSRRLSRLCVMGCASQCAVAVIAMKTLPMETLVELLLICLS